MCRPVHLGCQDCEYRRFFMWDECEQFWPRYQYIVVDQGNFAQRPRLGGGPDQPPACGGAVQAPPRARYVSPGACPRHECPSRQPLARPKIQLLLDEMVCRRRDAGLALPPQKRTDAACEARVERCRKAFADRYFGKRPVRPAARPDCGCEEEEEEEEGGGGNNKTSREETPAGVVVDAELPRDKLLLALLDSLPHHHKGLSQSCGDPISESSSEVYSCDSAETYQSRCGFKTQSV